MSTVDFLSSVQGFGGLETADLESLAERVQPDRFEPGEALMRAGEPGDTMHVIRSGRVRIPIRDENGAEKMVFHLGPRDLVGEMALLTGEPRSADVIAEQPTETLAIDRNTLQPLLEDYPPLAQFLTEILGRRLEEKGDIEHVGKYRLVGKLGEGASGKVYEALHPTLQRTVAIKMLSHSLVYHARSRERFLAEARLLASLTHPHIVQIFDTESAYATHFIVMEKLPGGGLAGLMRERGRLGPDEAARILRQMASALAFAHGAGFAHRDVKPANVAFDAQGTVKLMDFGLARPVPVGEPGRKAKSVDGTPQYIAPETAMGKVADGRVDYYALGVIAFEMLTGRLPFEHADVMQMLRAHVREEPPDIGQVRPDLPAGLKRFVRESLRKDPEERLSDPQRVQQLLTRVDGRPAEPGFDAVERVIHLRYPPAADAAVEQAVGRLAAELDGGFGVALTTARLHAPAAAASAIEDEAAAEENR